MYILPTVVKGLAHSNRNGRWTLNCVGRLFSDAKTVGWGRRKVPAGDPTSFIPRAPDDAARSSVSSANSHCNLRGRPPNCPPLVPIGLADRSRVAPSHQIPGRKIFSGEGYEAPPNLPLDPAIAARGDRRRARAVSQRGWLPPFKPLHQSLPLFVGSRVRGQPSASVSHL